MRPLGVALRASPRFSGRIGRRRFPGGSFASLGPFAGSRSASGRRSLRGFCLAAAVASVFCASAPAQPRTLYKPEHIENARENVRRYEWARVIVAGWERDAAFAMGQGRAFFEALIPELTSGTRYGQNCPVCIGPGGRMVRVDFRWRVEDPDRIACGICGTVFPHPEYPETGVLEAPRMGQVFTYYQFPEERALAAAGAPLEERVRFAFRGLSNLPQATSFSGLIRYERTRWAWGQALTLAKLYALTGEPAYAERVVWILDRFARVFPNYLYRSYDGSIADGPPAEVARNMGSPDTPRGGRFPPDVVRHPYGRNRHRDAQGEYSTLHVGFWGAGRLNDHGKGSDSGPLIDMIVAYDLVREARGPDGRRLIDAETDRRIVEDLLAAGCVDVEQWDSPEQRSLSNKGITTHSVSAALGVLLQQPERVRRALNGFEQVLELRYHFDGFYAESPGYAAHNYSNMSELPDLLLGYSDPPGYRPRAGGRIDAYDPFAHGRLRLALESMVRQLAPGNRLPVIGNVGYDRVLSPLFAEILAARLEGPYAGLLEALQGVPLQDAGGEYSLWYRSPDLKAEAEAGPVRLPLRSEWFPGWHVGVLRGDDPFGGDALYVVGNEEHWTVHTSHRHRDVLALSLYAFGEELAFDYGYFSGSSHMTPDGRPGQDWARSTLSHNLVVVDEEAQPGRSVGSDLELFGVAPGVQVIQASGAGAYPQCEEYRRTCVLVHAPDGGIYAADFFRVKGGSVHQYGFRAVGSLAGVRPANPVPRPTELSGAWSTWLENARSLVPETPHTFTWHRGDTRTDLTVLNARGSIDRIVVADAPGWRQSAEAARGLPPVQQVLAEHRARESGAALETRYAALLVPYRSAASPVLGSRLLRDDPDGAMAVEVRFAGRTDYIISTRDQHRRSYGPVTVAGEFAFLSVDELGRPMRAYLLNGTLLECGPARIALPEANRAVPVRSVSGRTYHLAEPLSPAALRTAWYVLADGPPAMEGGGGPRTGFEIESITRDSITVRDYPATGSGTINLLHAAWQAY